MKNIFLLLLLCVFTLQPATTIASKKNAEVMAPDFTLKSMSGKNVKLSELRGQVVMLNFWATWCGPCRQEMPMLSKLYSRYKHGGFMLLGINIDDDQNTARRMAKKLRISFPVLFDTDKKVSKLYRVRSMPSTIIIDRDGKLRYAHRGYIDGIGKEYKKEVIKLLKE